MTRDVISFVLLHISTLLVILLLIFISGKRNKSQIHYIFICDMAFILVISFAVMLEKYLQGAPSGILLICEYFAYFGGGFFSVTFMLTGIIYARSRINISYKLLLLFLVPAATIVILLTNSFHHLFYSEVYIGKDNTVQMVYGPYFFIHTVYSYICILIAIWNLLYFSIKNSGFFSKQALLFVLGSIIPVGVNMAFTLGLGNLTLYDTPITFTFTILFYILAVFKFDFLNINPIALQNIVDRISDAFIVINDNLDVVDFNKPFKDTFGEVFNIRRKMNVLDILEKSSGINLDNTLLMEYLSDSKQYRKPITFEKHLVSSAFDKYFLVEITPIITSGSYVGTIILLKDITQSKKDLETIKENQIILLEQERLASLGQLIGGIAHNLKTPIMSISGGIEALKDLVKEYDQSIDDAGVTKKDHHEIAADMDEWLEKMKPYCSYMSDIISAVKGQAVQMNASVTTKFTVDELVKRVDLLMKHELKKYHCILKQDFQIDMNTEIKGEISNLVQVFDNIIMNAVQSYDGREGVIEFRIIRSGDSAEFTFKDYGKGISQGIADRLFREMVTTKGKNGTGLGLYMSYSTIKGRFGGNMSFVTKEGAGTKFLISIPVITYSKKEEAV